MKTGFIYVWRDSLRNMYYVGSHVGTPDCTYISSSQWMNGEYRFRPHDFKRRIIAKDVSIENLRALEYQLIKQISPSEFGRRYYNLRSGRKPGCTAWNKGKTMPSQFGQKISMVRTGVPAWNKGKPNPTAADNGKKSADKVRQASIGRKREYREDGTWYWVKRVED